MATAAVIGCGTISRVHFSSIAAAEHIELVGVCDTNPDRVASAALEQGVPGFGDYRELLEILRPDVMHICTPHDQHVEIAIACLEAGVDVLLEKPLAHDYADAVRLIDAAASSVAKVGVCLQNRYNATAQAAHELLNSGKLGKVSGAWATVFWARTADYYAAAPWRGELKRSGGGLLINQAIHTIDLIQWLVGGVTRVQGHVAKYADYDGDIEDTAHAILQHGPAGPSTIFFASLRHSENTPVMLEIETEKARLRLEGDLVINWRDGRVDRVSERDNSSAFKSYWGTSHELLIEDFYARRDASETFWIDPGEAAKSLAIITEIYTQSSLLERQRDQLAQGFHGGRP